MGWRDKSYRIYAGCKNTFNLIENVLQAGPRRVLTVTTVAYFMILAVNTLQVTAFKENVAYTVRPAYRRFLSPVNADRSYVKTGIYTADSGSTDKSVNQALSGA